MFYGKKISNSPLISIIIDTFNRPNELKFTLENLLNQSYKKIEIIVIDNASNNKTKEYLQTLKNNKIFKFLVYQINQYNIDDPQKMIRICCNDALKISSGELIFYLSDDDWIEKNFFSKIIKHFIDNHKCTSAIGRVVNYYNDNKMIKYPLKNQPKYLKGNVICLDRALGLNIYDQSNPGHSYVLKADVLKYYGGFFAPLEDHQFFGIVAFGETAFDENALMYWRRHEGQLNKILSRNCYFEGQYIIDLLQEKSNNIIKNWEINYSKKESIIIKNYFNEYILECFYKSFFCLIFKGRFLNSLIFFFNKSKFIDHKLSFKFIHKGLKEAFLRSYLYRKYLSIIYRFKILIFKS